MHDIVGVDLCGISKILALAVSLGLSSHCGIVFMLFSHFKFHATEISVMTLSPRS
jgi:hypothetical protein